MGKKGKDQQEYENPGKYTREWIKLGGEIKIEWQHRRQSNGRGSLRRTIYMRVRRFKFKQHRSPKVSITVEIKGPNIYTTRLDPDNNQSTCLKYQKMLHMKAWGNTTKM